MTHDLRRYINVVQMLSETQVNLTPSFIKRVRTVTNRIASDIAADLPRGPQLIAKIDGLLQSMEIAPTMTVFRVELRPNDIIKNINSVGCHWCWDSDAARVYHGDNAIEDAERDGYSKADLVAITIVADVKFRDIDWVYTVATNLIHPAEREITIRSGAQVQISDIFAPGTFYPINHAAMVSGYYNEF